MAQLAGKVMRKNAEVILIFKLGVAMNDTAIGAYALSKGINKSTSEMSIQEKVGLAQQMFMEKTAKYAGNYAKENDTLAGSIVSGKYYPATDANKEVFETYLHTGDEAILEQLENELEV